MNNVEKNKMSEEERQKLMKEFLEKGGKIVKLNPGVAQGASSINKSKRLQWSEKDILKQKVDE